MDLKEAGEGYGQYRVMVCCEHGDEPLGSVKGKNFLHWLENYCLLKKDSAQRS